MIDQDETRIMEAIMRDQERRFVMNNIAKPATGETPDGKPRICEVLGVNVNEEWRVVGDDVATYRINEEGNFQYAMPLYSRPGHGGWLDSDMAHLLDFIEHPDRILRKPRFTEEEVADARAIVRVLGGDLRALKRTESGELIYGLLRINRELLPSLRPGQAVALKDITHDPT